MVGNVVHLTYRLSFSFTDNFNDPLPQLILDEIVLLENRWTLLQLMQQSVQSFQTEEVVVSKYRVCLLSR